MNCPSFPKRCQCFFLHLKKLQQKSTQKSNKHVKKPDSIIFISQFLLVNLTLLNYNCSKTLNLYGHSKHIHVTRPWWPRELLSFFERAVLKGRPWEMIFLHAKRLPKLPRGQVSHFHALEVVLPSLKLSASSHLKKDGWNIIAFHFGGQGASGAFAVSFRECKASEQLDNVPIPSVHFVCIQQILWLRFLQIHIDTDEGTSASLCHTSWSSCVFFNRCFHGSSQ